jgi:putative methyltransferase (TIGR04325 family)
VGPGNEGVSARPVAPAGPNWLRDFKRAARARLTTPGVRAVLLEMERWVPLMRSMLRRIYEREFATIVPFARRFRGVYSSFLAATAAAPASKPIGYDNAAAARMMPPTGPVWLSDYPVMFWLHRTLAECPVLLDIGGYTGISYYSYAKYLTYPEDLQWTIYDVPAVAAAGAEIAEREQSRGLRFTTEINRDTNPHTVLACGSLQVSEISFAELLSRMGKLPTHLIINKTPLTDLPDYVTLQDLGPSACPYWIFNRAKFIESIQELGYELIDSWANEELSCRIPFHEDHGVSKYSGLYFKAIR